MKRGYMKSVELSGQLCSLEVNDSISLLGPI